jgi:putative membrane protein
MVTPILDETELDRIAAAVAEAEGRTRAEIVCVITREVSTYPETPLIAGVVAALVLAPAAGVVGLGLSGLPLEAGWRVGHVAATGLELHRAVLDYAVLQAAMFGFSAWLAAIPGVRRALTPDGVKRARVRKAAEQQFQSARLAEAGGKTGLVIFVSLHDRKVEIIADPATHEACGEAVWRGAVEALRKQMRAGRPTDGLIEAVEICGAALAQHFPPTGPRENTRPDRALEL